MQWLVFRVKLWWHTYKERKRQAPASKDTLQVLEGLLKVVHGPWLAELSRRDCHTIRMVMVHRNVEGVFQGLEQALRAATDKTAIPANVTRSKRDSAYPTTLSNYLVTNSGVPLSPSEAYHGIQQLLLDLATFLKALEKAEQTYYRRQFSHLFEEVRTTLLALIEVSKNAKRKTTSGARIDR